MLHEPPLVKVSLDINVHFHQPLVDVGELSDAVVRTAELVAAQIPYEEVVHTGLEAQLRHLVVQCEEVLQLDAGWENVSLIKSRN